ncbi:ESPR-type extended signal peptide-containing protein [Salmonella enterica]
MFNRKRGAVVAVAETTKREGKAVPIVIQAALM